MKPGEHKPEVEIKDNPSSSDRKIICRVQAIVTKEEEHAINIFIKSHLDCKIIANIENFFEIDIRSEENILGLMGSVQFELASEIYVKLAKFKISEAMNTVLAQNFELKAPWGRSLGLEFNNKRVPSEIFTIFNQLKAVQQSKNSTVEDYYKLSSSLLGTLQEKLQPTTLLGSIFNTAPNEKISSLYQNLQKIISPLREKPAQSAELSYLK